MLAGGPGSFLDLSKAVADVLKMGCPHSHECWACYFMEDKIWKKSNKEKRTAKRSHDRYVLRVYEHRAFDMQLSTGDITAVIVEQGFRVGFLIIKFDDDRWSLWTKFRSERINRLRTDYRRLFIFLASSALKLRPTKTRRQKGRMSVNRDICLWFTIAAPIKKQTNKKTTQQTTVCLR